MTQGGHGQRAARCSRDPRAPHPRLQAWNRHGAFRERAGRGEGPILGAILVSDEVAELAVEGGLAAKAGEATAVVADRARRDRRGREAGRVHCHQGCGQSS